MQKLNTIRIRWWNFVDYGYTLWGKDKIIQGMKLFKHKLMSLRGTFFLAALSNSNSFYIK